EVTISYDDGGGSTWSYKDGTTVDRGADGHVTHMHSGDADFDRFTADDKPTHGVIAATEEQPQQDVSIKYSDAGSEWTSSSTEGISHVFRNSDDVVIRQELPDGTVYDSFTAGGDPLHGRVPAKGDSPAQEVSVRYSGEGSEWSYSNESGPPGVTHVLRDAEDRVVRQELPDGTVYDSFTAGGDPLHGRVPAKGDSPAQEVSVRYSGEGSEWTYTSEPGPHVEGAPSAGGVTHVFRDSENRIVRQELPDGTVYDSFNANEDPLHGRIPPKGKTPAQDVSVEYLDGGSKWTYSDLDGSTGSIVDGPKTYVYRDSKDQITRQELPDGTVYDKFEDNNPVHGHVPAKGDSPQQELTVEYSAEGSKWTYSSTEGTMYVYRNSQDQTIRQELTDGTVYDKFKDNDPVHGHSPAKDGRPASTIDVKYTPEGSVWTYTEDGTGDKTVVYRDTEQRTTRMESGGWVYTEFQDNHPTYGTKPGENGGPAETVRVKYDKNGSVWTYDDGKNNLTIITKNDKDQTILMQSGGWTFDEFGTFPNLDGEQPLKGWKINDKGQRETVTVTYNDNGSVWTYIDGDGSKMVAYRGPDGRINKMLKDGWTYTQFDFDGNPTLGTKGDQRVKIDYSDKLFTHSTFTDPSGHWTTIGTDKNGRPIFEIVDGIPAAYAVEIPKLLEASFIVRGRQQELQSLIRDTERELNTIDVAWDSPSGSQFEGKKSDVLSASKKIDDVLSSSITAMRKSYEHYVEAEGGNLDNMTPADQSPVFNKWTDIDTARHLNPNGSGPAFP
ncbi:hypothetical protein, partial [Actinoplanes sp. NBRC 103695]|uniref:hypothetical protein n=1 Tax=Actinoplanes sp. NBRC 103695 TaxID=3032202 RepID=UPI00249FE227